MYQSDRGNYRKTDSLLSIFLNTCLGKALVFSLIIGSIALLAFITCPSENYMRSQMNDNIGQCLGQADSIYMDGIDNAVSNLGYIFGNSELPEDAEILKAFKKHNRLEYHNHGIYSTLYVINNFHYDGARCAVGFFGLVIPMINSNDFVLRTTPVRREYNYKPVQDTGEEDFFKEMDGDEEFFQDFNEEEFE